MGRPDFTTSNQPGAHARPMSMSGMERGFLALAILVWSAVAGLITVFLREWRIAHRYGYHRHPGEARRS
jgi:hypothetical protein